MAVVLPMAAAADQTVTFGWDSSSDSSIVGYNIYYGTTSHAYNGKVSTGNTTSATVSNLVEGVTYYFAATSYDTLNQESVLSEEIVYTVPTVQAPVMSALPPAMTAAVGQKLAVGVTATGVGSLSYSLGAGAPAGAWINATNGIFAWIPQVSQASTTNVISVIVTDSEATPVSSAQSFTVVVQDYVNLSPGRSELAANSTGGAALTVYASTPVTNLQFTLNYASGILTNMTVTCTNPLVGTTVVTPVTPGQVLVTIGAGVGQSITGSQTLGVIGFQPTAGQDTEITYITANQLSALKTDGTTANSTGTGQGRVTIVGQDAMVEARTATGARNLAIYGPMGASYQVQSCNALGGAGAWVDTMASFTMTNLCQVIQLGPDTNSATFYRTRKL